MALTSVKAALDAPPYPQEVAAKGWHPELQIDRILTSDTWILAEDDERPWLLRIWFEAWRSVPAGSMPGDRKLFARRIGCTAPFLQAHAETLLRGWQMAADGRMYHVFITQQVVAMLERRHTVSKKVRDWRERKKAEESDECNRLRTGYVPVSNHAVTDRNRKQEQEQDKEETHPTLPKPTSAKLKPVWTLPPGIDPRAWSEFEGHRREIQKPLTDRARCANAKILAAMSPADQRRSVEATIASR
jgi:hypothetical protein